MTNKANLLDFIKEAQIAQPTLNLNTVTKQSLPQITTGLQNIVKAQDQLKQQQMKMLQQQQAQQKMAGVTTQQQTQQKMPGVTTTQQTPIMKEVESMTTHNQDKSPMGITDKNSPSDPMPIATAGAQATQTVQEQDIIRYETEDHIDDLLYHKFGFTYFKDRSKPMIIRKQDIQGSLFPEPNKPAVNIPMWSKMTDDDKEDLYRRNYKMREVMSLLDGGQIDKAFPLLNRVTQQLRENNFVKSKMFSIIAENETPRITKVDFINHIKNRKK